MKLKPFQKQDLARAALKDGLILSWDTGLGKTWALFLWPLLKVGYTSTRSDHAPRSDAPTILPKAPVLIIAPGDLHKQIMDEGKRHFHIEVTALDSQEAFLALTRRPGSQASNVDGEGRPILAPGFYITSYTQLTTNGVQKFPDPDKLEPRACLELLALSLGQHQRTVTELPRGQSTPESYLDVCHLYSYRTLIWREQYDCFSLTARSTLADLDRASEVKETELARWGDNKYANQERARVRESYDLLKWIVASRPDAPFITLNRLQQDFLVREFCRRKIEEYSASAGTTREYALDPTRPEGWQLLAPRDPENPGEADGHSGSERPQRRIKCVYSPSLADLSYNAFDCVVIDEGVKMKGEVTHVGRGVRSMEPKYRLVLTATPIKNRLPDIFRLAWWAVGGQAEAHARFPYRDDAAEREKFASTFMVTERNLTKEQKAKAEGAKASSSRYKKLTAEVCNVHLLWKLFGPIILRRRKQDAGVDIVPKIRKVIRCEMGTWQKKVYQYHLDAVYLDINGREAVGARLQALRIAAADPTSPLLVQQPGEPTERCGCWPLNSSGQPKRGCPDCHGTGAVPLPHRSGQAFIPKMATTLTLVKEILERKEQVVIFSAFNDPLDSLSRWLDQAGVRHVNLDGRVTQKARGVKASVFKSGRFAAPPRSAGFQPAVSQISNLPQAIPVMLAGVECMAEGHSFHLANNVILIAYSWAYDKFKQALDRVHRMNSAKPINVYVVLCQGTIDRKLESLVGEKGDAAELVLDGQLIGERQEEVNLAELLRIARREFNEKDNTLDEALLQSQWPNLRVQLAAAQSAWDADAPQLDLTAAAVSVSPRLRVFASARSVPDFITITPPAMLPDNLRNQIGQTGSVPELIMNQPTHLDRHDPLTSIPVSPSPASPARTLPVSPSSETWRDRVKRRTAGLARVQRVDLWSQL